MGLPQFILCAMILAGLLIEANRHGKPRDGHFNFWTSLVAAALQIVLLWWGGFFGR